jgi:hypothetical protein
MKYTKISKYIKQQQESVFKPSNKKELSKDNIILMDGVRF